MSGVSIMKLRSMSCRELDELTETISGLQTEKRIEEKRQTREAMEKIARERGFTLKEIMGARAVKTLHRNPENPKQTWTGHGRPPKWYKKPDKIAA